MTKEKIQEYSRKVASSTRTGLVVVTYEIIIEYLKLAQEAYDKGDEEGFIFNVKKAKQFVNQLSSCLDLQYDVSKSLLDLYLFANKALHVSILRKQPFDMEAITAMMERLKSAFEVVESEDRQGSVMKNSEQIYAGYTYGRNGLNEYSYRG